MTNTNEATNYVVYDIEQVSAIMREVKEIEEQMKEVEKMRDEAIAHANAFYQKQMEKLAKEREWRESQVIDYHQRLLAENPSRKTIETPYGKIKSTTRKATFKKPDNDVLLAVLETNGYDNLIKEKVTRTPDWANFKKSLKIMDERVVDENGLIIEDVEIEPAAVTFKVEVE